MTILIADDEPSIRLLLKYNLEKEGYKTISASNGKEAYNAAIHFKPDLVILDVMMPEMGGYEVCTKLKINPSCSRIPVIFLSARGEETDVINGYKNGAKDYITKPFSIKVLIEKIKLLLKDSEKESIIQHNGIYINLKGFYATVDDRPVSFTLQELHYLASLLRKPGITKSRSELMREYRGNEYDADLLSVNQTIKSLRNKLGNKRSIIKTIRGVGYLAIK